MYVYIYIYTYIYIYKYTYIFVYIHIAIYIYIERERYRDTLQAKAKAKAKLLSILSWALAIDPFLVSCATSSAMLLPRRRKPPKDGNIHPMLPPSGQQRR